MRKHHKIMLALLAVFSAVPFIVQADRAEPRQLSAIEASPPAVEAPLAVFAALPAREGMAELRIDPFFREHQEQRSSALRPTVPAAPAAAVAPPNPYRFAGEVRQPGATRRFLVRGNDILEVNTGDVLDGGYRVEAVEQRQVVLVHLATGARQMINAETPAATPVAATTAPATAATPFDALGVIVGGPAQRIPPKLRQG